jgi:broad specificity phosphatase PhoE
MQLYLIRHAQPDPASAMDPHAAALSEAGRAQAQRLATACAAWGLDMLCASTLRRAEETADAIHQALPNVLRWDLEELEDLTRDDLRGLPTASHLVSTWAPEVLALGYESAWTRVMAAWARIRIYAQASGRDKVALVGHHSTVNLMLLGLLDLDWRTLASAQFDMPYAAVCRVTLPDEGPMVIEWLTY